MMAVPDRMLSGGMHGRYDEGADSSDGIEPKHSDANAGSGAKTSICSTFLEKTSKVFSVNRWLVSCFVL